MLEIAPGDFNLPPQFTDYRPIQLEGIEAGVYSPTRFTGLCIPTGGGKSLTAMSISRITGYRTVILTHTKGLQDQYVREFGIDNRASTVFRRMGVSSRPNPDQLVDIRGKGNYQCCEFPQANCDDGVRMGCKACKGYQSALTVARNSQAVVTNYTYWMHVNRPGSSGLNRAIKPNPPELLILDEAHLAPESLASFLSIRVYEKEIMDLLHTGPVKTGCGECHGSGMVSGKTCWECNGTGLIAHIKDWVDFAKQWHKTAELEAKERGAAVLRKASRATRQDVETVKRYETLADKLDRLKQTKPETWTGEVQQGTRYGRRWEFDCVWPGAYAEKTLFAGIPHVILISATLRPKTFALLGVKSDQFTYKEWPRQFPGNRCPIYSIPATKLDKEGKRVGIRIVHRATEDDLRRWVERIDEIIASRLNRKGIIHTVSYDRQKYLMKHSTYAGYMIGNTSDPDSSKAAEVVHEFKSAPAPCILISPSFSTGWDFPMEEAEWQIITKIPFPYSKSKVIRERMKRDPHYLNYMAMQDLIQSCGRGMRSEVDRCENFIVDASLEWFLGQNRFLAPKWFDVRRMEKVPAPPKSLAEEIVLAKVRKKA